MKNETVNEIKQRLAAITDPSDPLLTKWAHDSRKGVLTALARRRQQLQKQAEQHAAFLARFRYEKLFWHQGITYVAGVDEVGRGPLAGPVVAGAVIIPADFDLELVNDSKQLTPAKRAELAPLIDDAAIATGLGVVDNHMIDKLNIYEATRLAMQTAVNNLAVQPERLIVDAMQVPVPIEQLRLIKGDAKSISVSAASILAKVHRDRLMDDYASLYPEYDFVHNAGYGTAKHLVALKQFGATPIHRISFAPVKKSIQK
ncbi:ribonuclease HII [Lactobacillus sp. Sy-1]|uniref:ribonuclease HII n=1 Tax=Lactobacillus sp. Sy-1 TaxID=2109645 RepID=UPI001C599210|nr:ribonuclease HII [Lactobacillus sp. Sy-1]MBW1605560.1 ribonuclease HII [Lactobacillus sp. Sy-1]